MDARTSLVVTMVLALAVAGAAPAGGAAGIGTAPSDGVGSLSESGTVPPAAAPVNTSADPAGATPVENKIASGLLASEGAGPAGGSTPSTDARGGERVRVVVEAVDGSGDTVADRVRANAGDVSLRHGNLVAAQLPRTALTAVANTPAVERIRRPNRPTTSAIDRGTIVSEGLGAMNVSGAYAAGHYGDNVTVAVVDLEFDATNPEIADNVVDVYRPGGQFQNSSGGHGTAVAELVVDTAPNVSLVLIDIESDVGLYDSMEYIRENTSVDVAVMSLSWYNIGPMDGSGEFNRRFEQSAANGTLWSVAAGNAGSGNHWHGQWQDGDDDGWLNVTADRELVTVDSSGSGGAWLQWDDWTDRDQDLDLYVYDSRGDFPDNSIYSSKNVQDGSPSAFEPTEATSLGPGTYYLAIKRESGTRPLNLTLFSGDYQSLDPSTAGQSVSNPTTDAVVTVGATYYGDNRVEPFSSRGPTLDGRVKPDVVAPDGVSTDAIDPFFGTSASAPHLGGVVALLKDKNESLTAEDSLSVLEATANRSAVPGSEPGNGAGSGLVDAGAAVAAVDYSETTPPTLTAPEAVDSTDGDGRVGGDDRIAVAVTATDADSGVKNVTADATAFGAGTVVLTDPDGDTRYNATFQVDASAAPANGSYAVPITAYDVAGNGVTVQTAPLRLNITDTTPPSITDATAVDAADGDGTVTALDTVRLDATVTDGGSGVDRVTADATAFGAGTVSLTDPNDDATYDATVTVDADEAAPNGSYAVPITATDASGNTNTTSTNALDLTVADRAAPSVSNFSVRVVGTRTIATEFDANETLADVSVRISNASSGAPVQQLTASDFGSVGGVYANETELNRAGRYRVSLLAANDSAGNDGSNGQNTTVRLVVEDVAVEHLDGPAPDSANLTSQAYLTQGAGGLLQVQLRDATATDYGNRTDLSNLGVEPNTSLAVTVTVRDWTPRLLLGAGRNATWNRTTTAPNTTTVNVTATPAELQYNTTQLDGTDAPWSETDRADVGADAAVDLAISDLPSFDAARRSQFDGAMLLTDAQTFGTPQYNATTGGVSLSVAAPHYDVSGSQNEGFFTAVLPTAVLDAWGVAEPASIEISVLGTAAEPAASTVTGDGIRLEIPIHYSAGEVELTPDATPPTVTNPTLSDQTDGDGTVADGDRVRVASTVTDGGLVASVTADATAFGGGTIDLTDPEGDDLYTGSVTVDGGSVGSDGSYASVVTATDAVGNARTVSTNSLSVVAGASGAEVEGGGSGGAGGSSAGGGGDAGGGGGGAPAPAPPSTVTPTPAPTPTPNETVSEVAETESGAELRVRNPKSGETVEATFDDRTRSDVGAVTQVRVRPAADAEGLRVAVTPPTPTTTDAPELTDSDPVGYFRADATGLSDDQITDATLRISVPATSLPADVAPEQVRLYRHHDGTWQRLATTPLGDGVYEATTPGFSVFAIGTERRAERAGGAVEARTEPDDAGALETSAATATAPATATADTRTTPATPEPPATEPTSTSQSAPGFGIGVAVVALLLVALRRRRL